MLVGPIVQREGVLPWFDDTLKGRVSSSYECLPNSLSFLVAVERKGTIVFTLEKDDVMKNYWSGLLLC